jgi:hypothetical protein
MELPKLTPHHFEILVVRELRKAGFQVDDVRVHRRTELVEPERGFLLELTASLGHGAWRRRAIIGCRRQERSLEREPVDLLAGRLEEARAEAAILFVAGDIAPDAVLGASERGVALLRVVDARSAYDSSGWGTPGQYPSWLPAYVAQIVERDVAGQVRYRLLEAGRSDRILGQLR